MKQNIDYGLILGSASPRRKELMESLGLDFRIEVRSIEEIYPESIMPDQVPLYLAELKASAFPDLKEGELLITADTVVICKGEVLGKPSSESHAIEMLTALSGEIHQVITGVALKTRLRQVSFSEMTKVQFANLNQHEIEWYVSHCKPMDKAGSYGIQDWIGARGISRIEGSYTNVVGLPTERLYRELKAF